MLVPLLELSVRHILIAVQTGLKHYHSIIWCSIVTVHPHILILIGLSNNNTHMFWFGYEFGFHICQWFFWSVHTEADEVCTYTHTCVHIMCFRENIGEALLHKNGWIVGWQNVEFCQQLVHARLISSGSAYLRSQCNYQNCCLHHCNSELDTDIYIYLVITKSSAKCSYTTYTTQIFLSTAQGGLSVIVCPLFGFKSNQVFFCVCVNNIINMMEVIITIFNWKCRTSHIHTVLNLVAFFS
jgi:hypothetical protein